MATLSSGSSDLPPHGVQATPIEKLRTLTLELKRDIKTEVPGKLGPHEFRQIHERFSAHAKEISALCTQCFADPSFSVELERYTEAVKHLHSLLPEQIHGEELGALSADDQMIASAHEVGLAIRKILLTARVESGRYEIDRPGIIARMSKAFGVESGAIQAALAKQASTHSGTENFLADAEAVFLDLAVRRLTHGKPLAFDEVHAICEAIPGIIVPREVRLVNFVRPHPVVVFETLHKVLMAAEKFDSCDALEEQVLKYLGTRPPVPPDLRGFFGQTKRIQDQIRKILAEDPVGNKAMIESLQKYEAQIAAFEKGLRRFPIVSTKALLEGSTNINPAYFLTVESTPCWVFKPMKFGYADLDKHFAAECTASQLNYHGRFPIPLTIPLSIKSLVGSAQFCIQSPLTLAKVEADKMLVDVDSLQRLVIFDLLFANNDRHTGNFLFQLSEGRARVAGIDHDSCLMFKAVHALKLEYSHLEALKQPLQKGMEQLFTREAIDRYAAIMKDNGVCHAQVEWMRKAAGYLDEAFRGKVPLINVIKQLEVEFESS